MFSKVFLAALIATFATVHADPNPSEPGPGDVYQEGGDCKIVWEVDASGTWKEMNIELMSGSNLEMNHITTVATIDGTDPAKTTFTYPCPQVTPNSAIYFYQFTSPASKETYWTTRFTIAAADGATTPPANEEQANGDKIPWGVGALEDPTLATPPPPPAGSAPGGNQTVSANSTSSSSTSLATTTGPTSPTGMPPRNTPTASKNLTSTSTPTPTKEAQDSGATGLHLPVAVSGALALLGVALMF